MERSWLERYHQPKHEQSSKDAYDLFMDLSNDPGISFDENKAWDRISSHIIATSHPQKTFNLSLLYRVAAVIALFAVSVFLYQKVETGNVEQITINTGAAPMTYELPDGSMVYLDVNSSISFSENFDVREISFEGLAYYDIVKSNAPFFIHMNDLNLKVLGTSFSLETTGGYLKSYVSEGLVQISDASNAQKVKPGEFLVYQKEDKKFEVSKNTNPNILSWKTGKFVFQNTPFSEVISNLEKYYKVDFLNVTNYQDCKVTAEFDRQELSEVLSVLGEILSLDFDISKSSVKTLGKGCR
ncbi:MAG: FecR family protein [Bacteroidota bacterium]